MKCLINRFCSLSTTAGKCHVFLTGATGILGSHLLYELLPLYVNGTMNGKLVLLVRPDRKNTPEQRIRNILTHPTIPGQIKTIALADLLKHIIVIEAGLSEFRLPMLPSGIGQYTVIHAAASVNLGQNGDSEKEIEENNYRGTLHLLHELAPVAQRFVFVSTAYSSGHREGEIANNFLSKDGYLFRNPYEQFKHETEKYIESFCTTKGIDWKIIRPSIICGRLIDAPYYAISRFLVFYLFARYAMAFQSRLNRSELRLHVPPQAGINIVPVDFVAKALVASLQTPVQQLNVVHPNNVSCRTLFQNGFRLINFENYSFYEEMPTDLSPVERMLYSTVGSQLAPYIDTPEHYFNTSLLEKILPEIKLPNIEEHFCGLIEFAANRNFVPLY